jgi:hypothetical protein
VASFPFQVEVVDPAGRFVMCRELERNRFALGPGSRLGDVEVTHVSQPRAIAADGTPRVDLFLFKLARPADSKRFQIGATVQLIAEEATQVRLDG